MILPGSRVLVFDSGLYQDDVSTPLSITMKPATVVCRYGVSAEHTHGLGNYPDLVDVKFDHKPMFVSRGHFTDGVEEMAEEKQEKKTGVSEAMKECLKCEANVIVGRPLQVNIQVRHAMKCMECLFGKIDNLREEKAKREEGSKLRLLSGVSE